VTGGGIARNLTRALPAGVGAAVDRSAIAVPRIFRELQRLGGIDDAEMAGAFNLGIGMVLVVAHESADTVMATLRDRGVDAASIGTVDEQLATVTVQ
jgi:phosphoribosylformylglycinamidine cyclo-ligase